MTSQLNPLRIRQALGRDYYAVPREFGPDGWIYRRLDHDGTVIVTVYDYETGDQWIHASISRKGRLPSYDDLKDLHRAIFGNGYAYQVFAPSEEHVNIHDFALHLFGRLDGKPALPEFAIGKSL